MNWTQWAQWIALAVGVVAGIYVGVMELRERRIRKKLKIPPNPARCADHEDRLRKTEAICVELPSRIHGLEANISEIRGDVKTLIQLHLKQ
jgi:hypothetical protein